MARSLWHEFFQREAVLHAWRVRAAEAVQSWNLNDEATEHASAVLQAQMQSREEVRDYVKQHPQQQPGTSERCHEPPMGCGQIGTIGITGYCDDCMKEDWRYVNMHTYCDEDHCEAFDAMRCPVRNDDPMPFRVHRIDFAELAVASDDGDQSLRTASSAREQEVQGRYEDR